MGIRKFGNLLPDILRHLHPRDSPEQHGKPDHLHSPNRGSESICQRDDTSSDGRDEEAVWGEEGVCEGGQLQLHVGRSVSSVRSLQVDVLFK